MSIVIYALQYTAKINTIAKTMRTLFNNRITVSRSALLRKRNLICVYHTLQRNVCA